MTKILDLIVSEKSVASFKEKLPTHIIPEKYIGSIKSVIAKNPDLLQCTPESIIQSAMTAAQLGIIPNTPMQLAYLIPYKRECQFQISYRGLITLARRSGALKNVEANCIYENDVYDIELGSTSSITHKPNITGDRGKLLAVYCIISLNNGSNQITFMTKAEIDAIRKRSKTSNYGPWVNDYEEMAKKTVVKRAFKTVDLSEEIYNAMEADNAEYIDHSTGEVVSKKEEQKKKVKDAIAENMTKVDEPTTVEADFVEVQKENITVTADDVPWDVKDE